ATEKAQRSQQPTRLDAGDYQVVLEPAAVADLVSFLNFAMEARSADEGRSFFAKPGGGTRVGEKLLGPFSLITDPADPLASTPPFEGDGLPVGRTVWFEDGVLKNLTYSRYWAQKKGHAPTVPPQGQVLRGSGREMTLEDLVKSTDRGVLV